MSSSYSFLDPIIVPMMVGGSVLDVACGYGRWGNLIRSNYWEAGMSEPPVVDGFDAFQPNVDYCRRQGHYREVWHLELPADIRGTWDTVLACEIVEHLREEDVERTLDILEGCARQRIIITTPSRPDFRPGLNSVVGFNEFEAHLSYVSADRLRCRGYRISGAGFGFPGDPVNQAIQGLKVDIKGILDGVARLVPELSNTIVAVKDVGEG